MQDFTDKLPSNQLPNVTATAEEKESYLPMVHGKATDSIATMAGSDIIENKLNNTGTISSGAVKLVIEKFNELSGTLGVSTHKLLSTAVVSFTALNHTGNKERKANFTTITIPLKEYALQCGYDVEEHAKTAPEEQKKETKRVQNALCNARKKINKDLAIMFSSSLSWTEKVRGKKGDYIDIRLIEAKGIRNGLITIRFSQTFAEYLIKLPLTQYPVALLGVDERNNNAYVIGLKMTEHYNMDNNQKAKTAQLLKVSTLLENLDLPTIATVTKNRNSWEKRIKEPFENSLDALTKCGFLSDWRYSFSKGVEMTDEEATSWESYEKWADTLIYFTLKDAPDHTARLEARAEEKKARAKRKRSSTQNK